MNKAPDTRNMLDNNKGIKKRTIVTKKKNSITLKELKENVKEERNGPLKLRADKKPTKGQLFKLEHGYSKSTKRSLQKHSQLGKDLISIEDYKKIRKTRKLAERKVRQKKHSDSVIYRRTHVKDKKSKGKKSK